MARRAYGVPSVNTDFTYDNLGRVTDIDAGSGVVKFAYSYVDDENNIYRKTFDHRSGDPYNQYSYDALDRLTGVTYHDSDTEAFAMDDLGNRDGNQTLRDDGTVNFVVDDDTNRYTSIGGHSITHDDAGNMTQDRQGYRYQYDYENRISRIFKMDGQNEVTVATFDYDALGRRIRKISYDSVPSVATLYYYNPDWQCLEERNGSDVLQRSFAYGNYIDEVLLMDDGSNDYYYLHDHLYSVVALLSSGGSIVERYEYDAYGTAHIMDASYNTRTTSSYSNPYTFTGRRLDELDNDSMEVMYYRHRYADPFIGRFLQEDGFDMASGHESAIFAMGSKLQYRDGVNLYEYTKSQPVSQTDPFGLETYIPPGMKRMIPTCPVSFWSFDPDVNLRSGFIHEIIRRGWGKTAFRIQQFNLARVRLGLRKAGCCCYDHVLVIDHGTMEPLRPGLVVGRQCWGDQPGRGPYLSGNIVRELCPLLCEGVQLELTGCNVGSGTREGFAMIFGACSKISSIKACRGAVYWRRGTGLVSCEGGWVTYTR
ncbi:MAG: hypothetical protein JXA82_05295 [Sedimentisphaerales bacterium]|nr:hypothetical protein [Sedimentisphaerales bacterium]